jgi:hypothetical protein
MAILGAILVVAGSAMVLVCAIFWAWSGYRQKGLSPDEGDHPPEVNTSCANVKRYRGRMLGQKIVFESGQVLSRASIGISQALLP